MKAKFWRSPSATRTLPISIGSTRRCRSDRMSVLQALIGRIVAGNHLDPEEIGASVEQLTDESISPELKADFLCSLALKGETVEEITAFARALRDKSIQPEIDPA